MLSWSFTTLAVAAKHPMTSISDYVVLETAFTVLQFVVVGPLIAWHTEDERGVRPNDFPADE